MRYFNYFKSTHKAIQVFKVQILYKYFQNIKVHKAQLQVLKLRLQILIQVLEAQL